MPQLDLDRYSHMIFWSLTILLLLYFTVIKTFCKKIGDIVSAREKEIQELANLEKKHEAERKVLQEDIIACKKRSLVEAEQIETFMSKRLLAEKEVILKGFDSRALEIKNQHKLSMNQLSSKNKSNLCLLSSRIESLVERYLFKQ
jgi:F0F1-type ATP synthase membrane subunit b/b'|tara:strand:- start:1623 stop:2057 length:435 start_codon:yes stop_codon:yes gene_type:complete